MGIVISKWHCASCLRRRSRRSRACLVISFYDHIGRLRADLRRRKSSERPGTTKICPRPKSPAPPSIIRSRKSEYCFTSLAVKAAYSSVLGNAGWQGAGKVNDLRAGRLVVNRPLVVSLRAAKDGSAISQQIEGLREVPGHFVPSHRTGRQDRARVDHDPQSYACRVGTLDIAYLVAN